MEWPLDNYALLDSDLSQVFRYSPQDTIAIRCLKGDSLRRLWLNSTVDEWKCWLETSVPSIQHGSGLVIILARRSSEKEGAFHRLGIQQNGSRLEFTRTSFLEHYNEKDRSYAWPIGKKIAHYEPDIARSSLDTGRIRYSGGSELRELPFERSVFKRIGEMLHIHGSISRVVSRADVPVFSQAQVKMGAGWPAIVYNCRSANTWANDLSLTITFFPQNNLTYAILFGCTAETERQILSRISSIEENVFHPMILPGIFAELEQGRMKKIVEATIDDIEIAIAELDSGKVHDSLNEESSDSHSMGTRLERRDLFQNTTFLRCKLQIWNVQLKKMIDHVNELSNLYLRPTKTELDVDQKTTLNGKGEAEDDEIICRMGGLIKDRLRELVEEYEEMIEECSMRVEAMTIATQWAQGNTNVDIATAAGRDSRQMRSVALVTMVFLPGTFFATLFSMTFFNWFPTETTESGGKVVSRYVWIYFLLTGLFTVATLFSWWFFLIHRQKNV